MIHLLEKCKPRRLYVVVLNAHSEALLERYSGKPLLLFSAPVLATYSKEFAESYIPATSDVCGSTTWEIQEVWGPSVIEMELEISKIEKELDEREKKVQ